MMAFVRFYLWIVNKLKNKVFSKVYKILDFFLDYSCAHVLEKRTSKWALDKMEKMPKQPLETFVIHFNPQKTPLFWSLKNGNFFVGYWSTRSCTRP
jgi:hypothetical protein